MMRRAFEEELKKNPRRSEVKDTSKLASGDSHHARPFSIPSAERAAGSQLPVPGGRRGRHTRGRESRSENSRHFAGGRCDKSLAEHRTKSHFKISNRHLTALKRASLAFLCLYNALCGRMRVLRSTDVMGTYCSPGRCGANRKALSLIQTLLGCLVHHWFSFQLRNFIRLLM